MELQSPSPLSGRTGRRPGPADSRPIIEAAALRQFAARGFDGSSMRSIALEAGVDPTLVGHFYRSKQGLFDEAIRMPFEPADVIPRLLAGPRSSVGRRLAEFVVGLLTSDEARLRLIALLRVAATEDEGARRVRELVTRDILTPVATGLGADEPELRGALAGAQTIGMVFGRHLIGIDPLAALPPQRLVLLLAPVYQIHLAGDLPTEPAEGEADD